VTNPENLQIDFHQVADSKRFWNRIKNPFLSSKERNLATLIANHLPEGGKTVLEIGCGEGSNLFYLQEQLKDVNLFAIDFSKEKVHFIKTFLKIKGNAVCGNALHLPFGLQKFDMVFCRDLLHHVNWARDQVLSEAFRVLKPNGVVVVIESDGRKLLNRVFQFLVPAERGLKDSTPDKLKTLGEKFGDVKISYTEPTLIVRAVGYLFGWPDGNRQNVIRMIYAIALAWEKLVEMLVPKNSWAYMLISIHRKKG
jgi:ubiquinone/menaquinone biosynthesis C-methylase UbiE